MFFLECDKDMRKFMTRLCNQGKLYLYKKKKKIENKIRVQKMC